MPPTLPRSGKIIDNPVKPTLRPRGLLVNVASEIPVPDDLMQPPPDADSPPVKLVGDRWWMGGVTFVQSNAASAPPTPQTLDWCDYDSVLPDADDAETEFPVFAPFALHASEACSTLGVEAPWLVGRAEDRVRMWQSYVLAFELLLGTTTSNPNLTDAGAARLTDDVVRPPRAALEMIERSWALHYGNTLGYIHMPPSITSFLTPDLVRVGDEWETGMGNKIITDSGYGANFNTGATSRLIYMSGPIAYQLGPVRSVDLEGTVDFSRNTATERSSGLGIVVFDPETVIGTTVDTSLDGMTA